MDDNFFICRDAQYTANDLNHGNAAGAAARLREDCAHMSPREFSQLIRETKNNEAPGCHPDLALFRNGQVMVKTEDNRYIPAGQLPPQEMARLIPPPPPPVVIERPCPPPVVIERPCPPPVIVITPDCRPPVYHQPHPVYIPEPHRQYGPPGRVVIESRGLNNTIVDTIGGAAIGAIVDKKNPGKGAAIGGIIGLGVGTALDNANK